MLSDDASDESATDDESGIEDESATDESAAEDTVLSVADELLPPSQAVREEQSASDAIIARSLFFIAFSFKAYFEKNLCVQINTSPFESSL